MLTISSALAQYTRRYDPHEFYESDHHAHNQHDRHAVRIRAHSLVHACEYDFDALCSFLIPF
jgi:hypothetical protein